MSGKLRLYYLVDKLGHPPLHVRKVLSAVHLDVQVTVQKGSDGEEQKYFNYNSDNQALKY